MSKLDDPCLSGGNGRGRHAELLPPAQAMVLESDGFVGRPQLDFEGWRAFLRSSALSRRMHQRRTAASASASTCRAIAP